MRMKGVPIVTRPFFYEILPKKAWKKDDMKTESTIDYIRVMDCYDFGNQEPMSRGNLIRYLFN